MVRVRFGSCDCGWINKGTREDGNMDWSGRFAFGAVVGYNSLSFLGSFRFTPIAARMELFVSRSIGGNPGDAAVETLKT